MKMSRHLLVVTLLLLFCVVAGATASTQQNQGASPPAAKFDINTCRNCHEHQVSMFERTYHGHLANGCAECHGNVAEHVEKADPSVVTSFKTMPASQIVDKCLTCHNKNRQANWRGGMHDRRGVACTNCHSIHNFQAVKAQIKTAMVADTCFQCHQAIRAQTMRTSHHPIREGRISCADCHDPHDGRSPKYISAASVNEKCYQCHTEKRGPMLWEHAPVRENCLNCHNPHGSNHDKLLVAKRPYLCQRCHSNTRHPGTLYDLRGTVAGLLPNNRELNRACQNCHANIHGSNSPSAPYFGR